MPQSGSLSESLSARSRGENAREQNALVRALYHNGVGDLRGDLGVKRIWQFFTEKAWLIGFMLIALSSLPHVGKAQRKEINFEVVPKMIEGSGRLIPLKPSPLYAKWWREIAACEGLPIRPAIDSVQFFAVNATEFEALLDGTPLRVIGLADPDNNQLFVTLELIADEALLKHEMLHFLLAWSGYRFRNFHPIEFFETCGIHRTGP